MFSDDVYCSCSVHVLLAHREEALKILADYRKPDDDPDPYDDSDKVHSVIPISEWILGSCEWDEQFKELGIAYTNHWDAWDDSNTGYKGIRFTDGGELVEFDIDEGHTLLSIETLKYALDGFYTRLKDGKPYKVTLEELINEVYEKTREPGWENQEANGKLYRLMRVVKQ